MWPRLSPRPRPCGSRLANWLARAGFQFYALSVVLASLVLIFYVSPRYGHKHLIVYVLICSLVGSISVIGVKVCCRRG